MRRRTPDPEVDRGRGPVVLPSMPPTTAPRARFEARIDKDGSVTLPLRLVAPALSAIFGGDEDPRPRPTDPSSIADILARELLQGLVRAGQDSPSLVKQVVGVLGSTGISNEPDGPLLMKKANYARRVGYSVRKLDQFIAAGLPIFGAGRSLRIVVKAADEWLLSQDTEHLDEIDLLAMKNAKKSPRDGG